MRASLLLALAGIQDPHTGQRNLLGADAKAFQPDPAGTVGPFVLAAFLGAGPRDLDRPVPLEIVLMDGTGKPVLLPVDPDGPPQEIRIPSTLTIGAPAELDGFPAGSTMLIGFPNGLPLRPGAYRFRILVDGGPVPDADARFVVVPAAPPARPPVPPFGKQPGPSGPGWTPGTPFVL